MVITKVKFVTITVPMLVLIYSNNVQTQRTPDKTTNHQEIADVSSGSLYTLSTPLCHQSCIREQLKDQNITFPKTPIAHWSIPEELCLQDNYTLVTRNCLECGQWGKVSGNCSNTVQITNITRRLFDIYKNTNLNALDTLEDIVNDFKNVLTPVDLYYISISLEKTSEYVDVNYDKDFVETINEILDLDPHKFNYPNKNLSISHKILNALKNMLSRTKPKLIKKKRILANTKNNSDSSIGMITTNNNQNNWDLRDFNISSLYSNNFSSVLETTNFELAFVEKVRQDLSYAIFQNPTLFYNNISDLVVGSWIIGLTPFKNSVKIYYKAFNRTSKSQEKCATFEPITNQTTIFKNVTWQIQNEAVLFKDGYYMCEFLNGTTYFTIVYSNQTAIEATEMSSITTETENTVPTTTSFSTLETRSTNFETTEFIAATKTEFLDVSTIAVANSTPTFYTSTNSQCSSFCLRQQIEEYNISFATTPAMTLAIPQQICIQNNFISVTRPCLECGKWGKINGRCSKHINLTVTKKIFELLYSRNLEDLNSLRIYINSSRKDLNPTDIYYATLILEDASQNSSIKNYYKNFFDVINEILDLQPYKLTASQSYLNSTDKMLESIERVLLDKNVKKIQKKRVIVDTLDGSDFVIGMVAINQAEYSKNLKNFEIKLLYAHNYSKVLEKTNFEAAFVLENISIPKNISFIIFKNSYLFNEIDEDKTIGSWIIGLAMPGSIKNVSIYYKSEYYLSNRFWENQCTYWTYGTNQNLPIKGHWQIHNKATFFKNYYFKCYYSNVATYFGLVNNERRFTNWSTQSLTCPKETITLQDSSNLTFPETLRNTWATPRELCLHDNYAPVRRFCTKLGNWENFTATCSNSIQIPETTELLHNLTYLDGSLGIENIHNLFENTTKNIKAVDVHYISQIIDKASLDFNTNSTKFFEIVDNLIGANKSVLEESQMSLNSTDTILDSLDKFLLSNNQTEFAKLPNLFIETINDLNDTVGAMFIKNNDSQSLTSFEMIKLFNSTYKDQLNNTMFEMAFIIPANFLNTNQNYFVTLFSNEHLFNDETKAPNTTLGSWIISLLLPKPTNSSSIIEIYFKEFQATQNQTCNHWKYGIDYQNIPIKGSWNFDNKAQEFRQGYYVCYINHTTHFGMLISNGSIPSNFILDLLTIFGALLSIIGIAIILLTAVLFKTWIANPSNKIILNLSVCLLLVIVLFFISDLVVAGGFCLFIGMALHYVVIAQFCWALAISYSNYRRLYLGLHYHIKNVVIKYCVMCWGLPLIIVTITAAINSETYNQSTTLKFCYPKQSFFLWGVFLPIGIILTANIIIYIFIILKLSTTSVDLRKHKKNKSCAKEKSIFLMFFVMGLTWIFGVLAAVVNDELIFAYLFCTMATAHGFVIFVFYIFDSPNTKELWMKKIRQVFRRKEKVKKGKSESTNTTESFNS